MRPFLRFRFNRRFAFIAALLVLGVGIAIAFFNQEALGRQKLRELDIEAAILAQTVAAPVMFSDPTAAQESAAAMGENPQVEAVGIYAQNGAMLASFARAQAEAPPAHPAVRPAAFQRDVLDVVRPVARGGQTYGAVYLRLRREPLLNRLARDAPIALLMLMTALVLAVAGAAQGALSSAYEQLEQRAKALAAEIEHRKDAEEALVQSRKMEAIGQLTGGVAHDFNNLLMVVSGGLRMLERSDDPDRRKKTIEAVLQAVDRGGALTRQLLAFARRQAIELSTVALDERLNAMRSLLERSLRADILLDISLAPDLPPVMTDPVQLELAVLNLCVNARDAMPKGGIITISGRVNAEGERVELSVHDTGLGMTAEVMKRVFEPYFTTKPMGQGTGLGLSQVYGLAQQSGGEVRVSSEINVGTTVVLSLPVSKQIVARKPEVTSEQVERVRSLDVLVVEDDDGVAETVCSMLEELGHRPMRVASAQAALDRLTSDHPFDLVFSDIIMPGGINGIELARAIADRLPRLPVLLTTGFSGTPDGEVGRPLLRKPYDIEALRDAVASLMAASASQTHRECSGAAS